MTKNAFNIITRTKELETTITDIAKFEKGISKHESNGKYARAVYTSIHKDASKLIKSVGMEAAFEDIQNIFPPYLGVLFDEKKSFRTLEEVLSMLETSANDRHSINLSNLEAIKEKKLHLEAIVKDISDILTPEEKTEIDEINEAAKEFVEQAKKNAPK